MVSITVVASSSKSFGVQASMTNSLSPGTERLPGKGALVSSSAGHAAALGGTRIPGRIPGLGQWTGFVVHDLGVHDVAVVLVGHGRLAGLSGLGIGWQGWLAT
jgi:hypothetical protein